MLCSALELYYYLGETWFCFVIFPSLLCPPASFSFYKKVSENLLQAKIDGRSMLGHTCLCLSLKDPPVPRVHRAVCWRICMFCFLLGQSSLVLQPILFFMLLVFLSSTLIWRGLENPTGISIYSGSSSLMSRHTQEEVQLRLVGTAVPSCSLQLFML